MHHVLNIDVKNDQTWDQPLAVLEEKGGKMNAAFIAVQYIKITNGKKTKKKKKGWKEKAEGTSFMNQDVQALSFKVF